MEQRSFRREQLAELDAPRPVADKARREVRALLAAAARRALADIDLALARMKADTYGRCRACNDEIPLAVLQAIPEATLCLSCQNVQE